MKKILIIVFLIFPLFASTTHTKIMFESGVSFYGKVGETYLDFKEDSDTHHYVMKVTAKSTGMLKAISNNRVDIFLSEGIIKDGVYIPQTYTKRATENGYERVMVYKFDYKNNKITKDVVKKEDTTTTEFNHELFRFVEKTTTLTTKKSSILKMYKNDFLTLYLNFTHHTLQAGNITYLDQKEGDYVSLIDDTSFNINKNRGEHIIKIKLINDAKSQFFKKALSELSFYGDAYIEKISERISVY